MLKPDPGEGGNLLFRAGVGSGGWIFVTFCK